jgi:hypothetical protein
MKRMSNMPYNLLVTDPITAIKLKTSQENIELLRNIDTDINRIFPKLYNKALYEKQKNGIKLHSHIKSNSRTKSNSRIKSHSRKKSQSRKKSHSHIKSHSRTKAYSRTKLRRIHSYSHKGNNYTKKKNTLDWKKMLRTK